MTYNKNDEFNKIIDKKIKELNMNIFSLNQDPIKCSQELDDKRQPKWTGRPTQSIINN